MGQTEIIINFAVAQNARGKPLYLQVPIIGYELSGENQKTHFNNVLKIYFDSNKIPKEIRDILTDEDTKKFYFIKIPQSVRTIIIEATLVKYIESCFDLDNYSTEITFNSETVDYKNLKETY